MFEFTIDRSKWIRGKGPECSYLLRRDDGKQCCVGQFGSALRIPSEILSERRSVTSAPYGAWPAWCKQPIYLNLPEDLTDIGRLYEVNDLRCLDDAEREARITELFAKHGVKVTFVDGGAR